METKTVLEWFYFADADYDSALILPNPTAILMLPSETHSSVQAQGCTYSPGGNRS